MKKKTTKKSTTYTKVSECIYKSSNNTYRVRKTIDGIRGDITFDTLKEAKKTLERWNTTGIMYNWY